MTKKTFYKKWNPLEGIPDKIYCEAIHDDYESFRIILQGEDVDSQKVKISFEKAIAYRNINESFMLVTLDEISDREISSLYTVENSKFIKWFHEESCGIYKDREIIHYSILTPNDIVDVLSEIVPTVEWLKS